VALDLTTLARVKATVPIRTADVDQDALLSQFISALSAQAERYLRREVLQVERYEVHAVRDGRTSVALKAYPVIATDGRGGFLNAFNVKLSSTTSFSSSPTLVRNRDYVLEEPNGTLRLSLLPSAFTTAPDGRATAPGYVQVQYSGGMAATTAAFVSAYPEIAAAIDVDVVHFWKRRNSPEGEVKVADSVMEVSGQLQLLKHSREVLDPYRRRTW
jgi:hypothetical protein